MGRSQNDLISFYNSLPNWAQLEFQRLLQLVEEGEIESIEMADIIQDFMNRVEQARAEDDSSKPP